MNNSRFRLVLLKFFLPAGFLLMVSYSSVVAQSSAQKEQTNLSHLMLDKYHKFRLPPTPVNSFTMMKRQDKSLKELFKVKAAFCVLESRLEKRSNVPLRIRIGNLDYVNYLENKDIFNTQSLNHIQLD